MPYIMDEKRDPLEDAIRQLAEVLQATPDDEVEGRLNYTIMEVVCRSMKRPQWRYIWINRVVGVLGCVLLEFYRRIAEPYENTAMAKNGDIPSFQRMWDK